MGKSAYLACIVALACFGFILLTPASAQGDSVKPVSGTSHPDSNTASLVRPDDYHYILGPQDVINVQVLDHPDFNVKVPISADGTIALPYLGNVQAANLTVSQLHKKILNELQQKGIFKNISLEVNVASYASRYVTVLGGVVTPGLIPIDRAYRLSEILARAGGIRDGGSNYVVLRRKSGDENKITMDELATGDSDSDPYVSPGDKIYVPTAVFYIKGEVRTPGAYPLSLHMTLAMALARGGGLTPLGSDGDVTVIRDKAKITPKDLNFPIDPNDVIDVGEGWF